MGVHGHALHCNERTQAVWMVQLYTYKQDVNHAPVHRWPPAVGEDTTS
jgi:hypothetical protein